jgi:hypothetical protein
MISRTHFFVFIGLLTFFFTACEKDSVIEDPIIEVAGLSLDINTLEMEFESSIELVATLEPNGAEGEIVWTTSDTTVAVVDSGIVTGVYLGEAFIIATYVGSSDTCVFSDTCVVTVTEKVFDLDNLPPSLNGTNYYPIQIDDLSYAIIEDRINLDLRPDDIPYSKKFYVWDWTFVNGTKTGLNSYGMSQGWQCLKVNTGVTWSGGGYNTDATYGYVDMTDLYVNPEGYVFHMALKSSQESTTYKFIFTDMVTEASVVIGSDSFGDQEPYMDFERDGKWHEIEVPLSYLTAQGITYEKPYAFGNVLAFLAGGTAGTTIDLDAAFFYKPAAK